MSNKTDHEMILEIHQVLKDPDNGLCIQVKTVREAVYGNGKIGLKTQVLMLWGVVLILMFGGQEAASAILKAVVK